MTMNLDQYEAAFKPAVDALEPILATNEASIRAIYHFAIDLHKDGYLDRATFLYNYVLEHATMAPELQAWTHYKLAEMDLETGKIDPAMEGFHKALGINPGIAKAAIYVAPKDQPLSIVLGETVQWDGQGIPVQFYFNKGDQWSHYFSYRRIDTLWVTPPALLLRFDMDMLRHVLDTYFSPQGQFGLAIDATRKTSMSVETLRELSNDRPLFRQKVQQAVDSICQ